VLVTACCAAGASKASDKVVAVVVATTTYCRAGAVQVTLWQATLRTTPELLAALLDPAVWTTVEEDREVTRVSPKGNNRRTASAGDQPRPHPAEVARRHVNGVGEDLTVNNLLRVPGTVGPGLTLDNTLDRERWLAIALGLLAIALVAVLTRRPAPGRSSVIAAVVLLVGQAVWLRLHNVYEGPSVLGVGSHGLAVADLGVPPSLAIGIAVLVRRFRR
jgi:hypothetical protein